MLPKVDHVKSLEKNELVFVRTQLSWMERMELQFAKPFSWALGIGVVCATFYCCKELFVEGKFFESLVIIIVGALILLFVLSASRNLQLLTLTGTGRSENERKIVSIAEKLNWNLVYLSKNLVIIDPSNRQKFQIAILYDGLDIRINATFVEQKFRRMPMYATESDEFIKQFRKEFELNRYEKT